ncbi:hypothetical protein GJAV_G00042580 [Gymnothorax javanicus]|nr:hypothetical protein GJAV_G00042580 [Gymnothorax javanicus]
MVSTSIATSSYSLLGINCLFIPTLVKTGSENLNPNSLPVSSICHAPNSHLLPLDRLKIRDTGLTRNSLAPIRDHCTHRFSLPPDQVSQGVKKSKSLPLGSLGRARPSLPPPVSSRTHRIAVPHSLSLCSFLPTQTGDPLRNIHVLPAIQSHKKRSLSPPEPQRATQSDLDNRT